MPTARIKSLSKNSAPPIAKAPPPNYTWVGWAATGALVAGATVTGIVALNARSDFESFRTKTNAGPVSPGDISDADSARSRGKTFSVVTDILGGAAIVTAGVSLYFTLKKSKKEAPHDKPAEKTGTAEVLIGPQQIGFRGTF